MLNWFELSAPELAYLAEVDTGRLNVLDHVTVAGEWLRDAGVRQCGEEAFGRRVDAADQVPAPVWAAVMAAAREFGRAERGASLIVRGEGGNLCLLMTELAQVAVTAQGLGIRLVDEPLPPQDLVAELLVAEPITSGASIRWLGGHRIETRELTIGSINSGTTAEENADLLALCEFALNIRGAS